MEIVFIVHYFPPVNSAGAKRIEAISKYLAAAGHAVTVITTKKTSADGKFTEALPSGVNVIELNAFGRRSQSIEVSASFESMHVVEPSWHRRLKNRVQRYFGQIPDPRLLFAFSFLSPVLDKRARQALSTADVVIGSSPPWSMLLAAVFCKKRFNIPCVLDYRDQFSECHGMPGGTFAKWLERRVDQWLVRSADHIVTISEPMASYYKAMKPEVSVIMNGYDHQVLEVARSRAVEQSPEKVRIRYMGFVYPGRIPYNFMRALVRLKEENPSRFESISVEYYGGSDLVREAITRGYPSILSAFCFNLGVPYLSSLQLMVESDYLLFAETSSKASLSAQGILTTKLFEYIGAGRPVLADISAETLAGSLLRRASEGNVVGDTEEIFLDVLNRSDFYIRKEDVFSEFSQGLSRQAQALQYAGLIRSFDKGE
ncbi:glycosyltransferase [Pseudomonas sp. XS1P51]